MSFVRQPSSGHYEDLVAQRDRVLAICPPSHRRRILGQAPRYRPARTHEITVDLRTGERQVVGGPIAAPRVFIVAPPPPPPAPPPHGPSAEDIIAAILAATGISRHEFFHEHRSNLKVSRARQMGYWLTKKKIRPDMSWPQVGRMFKRDHSSCLAGARRVEAMKDRQPIADWLLHPAIASLLEAAQ